MEWLSNSGVVYIGMRADGICQVWSRAGRAGVRCLNPRLDLDHKLPSGFEWGAKCSGAYRLAIAILADATGSSKLANRFMVHFAEEFLMNIMEDELQVSALDVLTWIKFKLAATGETLTISN